MRAQQQTSFQEARSAVFARLVGTNPSQRAGDFVSDLQYLVILEQKFTDREREHEVQSSGKPVSGFDLLI